MHDRYPQSENVEPSFKELPPEWKWVRDEMVSLTESGSPEELEKLFGIAENSDTYVTFHGTVADKLPGIMEHGMRAFKEADHKQPRIFVTSSPTMALHHIINNGPHDTLRKKGLLEYEHDPGSAVLLAIHVPKDWLWNQSESQAPLDLPDWYKDKKGITPEDDRRVLGYERGVVADVKTLLSGQELDDVGHPFPVDHIPAEFITVVTADDHQDIFGRSSNN